MDSARDRLIVALDVPTAAEAQRIVAAFGESVSSYKVGKQLFTAAGPAVVRDLSGAGRKVFLDLKYHDIPSTVAAAVRAASELGVAMLTVHASGGSKMLKAAVEAAGAATRPPLVLAVTVLTSFGDADLKEIGVAAQTLEQALRLASLAQKAGCGGVVASAQEARAIRQEMGAGFAIVTPGVRPAGGAKDDQTRVATPAEAIAAGADYIVVGRPITGAKDPAAAARAILEEISPKVLA
ncbi:MAG TPA: orotidine-5'-phosphate decarboxylase [Terriglobales bacterium]|nr:orotidine-5'-phosphate decarboxylase [Terriglobales bacterium]